MLDLAATVQYGIKIAVSSEITSAKYTSAISPATAGLVHTCAAIYIRSKLNLRGEIRQLTQAYVVQKHSSISARGFRFE